MSKIYDLKGNLIKPNVVRAKPQLDDDSKQKELLKDKPQTRTRPYYDMRAPWKHPLVDIVDHGPVQPPKVIITTETIHVKVPKRDVTD